MNRTAALVFRALCLCCAGFAADVIAQSNTPAGSGAGFGTSGKAMAALHHQYLQAGQRKLEAGHDQRRRAVHLRRAGKPHMATRKDAGAGPGRRCQGQVSKHVARFPRSLPEPLFNSAWRGFPASVDPLRRDGRFLLPGVVVAGHRKMRRWRGRKGQ